MANDDNNLVSEVKVEGIDSATQQWAKYGDAGAAAFQKIANASSGSSSTVQRSTDQMDASVKKLNNSLGITPATMQKLQSAASNLGSALSAGAQASTRFVTGTAALAGSAATAVVGLGKLASWLTSTVRGVNNASTAIDDNTQAMKKNNQQAAQTAASAAQYQSELRTLDRQVALGRISYEDYNTQLMDLNNSYQESMRVQRQVQAAQDEALRQNQELEKQAAKRQEFEKLSQTFGGTLTSSLIRLGNAYDQVSNKVVTAFGPVAANLVDRLSNAVEKNMGNIEKFINTASAALDKFVSQNGPQIDQFLASILSIVKSVGESITSVAIPAFRGLVSVLDVVAGVINKVFGTNLNGMILAIVASIVLFTGALGPLITVFTGLTAAIGFFLTALSPLGLALIAITAAIIALISIDWTPLQTKATAAWTAVVNFFNTSIEAIKALFAGFWSYLAEGWNASVAQAIAAWQTLVDWFNGLVSTITGIFSTIGQAIKDAFNSALEWVVGLFNSWATRVKEFIQPIIDMLNKVRSLMAATGGGGEGVKAAGGGYIRGPGTSTSDSIPAWLSDREFVVKAKSVAKYGVGFLRAINSGKLDLNSLGARMGFAAGGLVRMPTSPSFRFAEGGLVQGINSPDKVLNLTIGGETFAGLLMPDDVANSMTRYAVARNSRSAGRRPSWVSRGK